MYQVYCDKTLIYDLRDDDLMLLDPQIELEVNKAGSFEFTILPTHPHYDQMEKLASVITVLQDGEEIFCGRILDETVTFYNQKKVYCEGELAYLLDSIQREAEYPDLSVHRYLKTLLDIHNEQVEEVKQFEIGAVTVVDSGDSLYWLSNMENTLDSIKSKLLDRLGGYIVIRKANGIRYLDYLQEYPNTNSQLIDFGKNLLDYSNNTDAADIATSIVPRGAKIENGESIGNIEERVKITEVNNGLDYIYSEDAVKQYGWITRVVYWDDVNIPLNLLRKAEEYLKDIQFESMVLEVKAVDLHCLNKDIERIKLGDSIRVRSEPHGLDRYFPVSKLVIYLDRPDSNMITLGTEVKKSLTERNTDQNSSIWDRIENIPSKDSILKQALENATQLINSHTTGYVVTRNNEILIMDTDDMETAANVWRWNMGGLGYSKSGYEGPFELAITMDGTIAGQFIAAGSIAADSISISYRQDVERQIREAEINAIGDTDEKLKDYWTLLETETAIKNTADAVLISARAEAIAYTDEKLKGYTTSSELEVAIGSIRLEVSENYPTIADMNTAINMSASEIKLEVSKKVGENEVNSLIRMWYDSITISADKVNLSGYVTFSNLNVSGQTNINAGNLRSGTITGIEFRQSGDSRAIQLSNGYLNFYSGTNYNEDQFRGNVTFNNSILEIAARNLQSHMILGSKTSASASIDPYYVINIGNYNYQGYNTSHIFFGNGVAIAPGSNNTEVGLVVGRQSMPSGITTPAVYCHGDIKARLNLACDGVKYRVIKDPEYGDVHMTAYETAEGYFGDIGYGKTDENGTCYITLSDKFLRTVVTSQEYAVFIQTEGIGQLYPAEKNEHYFIVRGTANLNFTYEIKAKQVGVEIERMVSKGRAEDPEQEHIERWVKIEELRQEALKDEENI